MSGYKRFELSFIPNQLNYIYHVLFIAGSPKGVNYTT